MPEHFDAIVIGTGQAGPPLADRLVSEGLKVAVIERHRFGGTCVNTGCVPTKTIVASAYVAQMARRAAEYGVETGGSVTVDLARVKARKDAIVDRGQKGIKSWMTGLDGATVIEGHARFEGPRAVRVGDRLLQADRIFINTGGRALVPDMPGLDRVPYLTNTSILELDTLPEHLLVVGGSYIGLEFAHAFRRFGSRVTVVEMADRIVSREDTETSEAIAQIFGDEGIEIRTGAECLAVDGKAGDIRMQLDCTDGAPSIIGTHVLLAVGRRPNTDDLDLDEAGVATDAKGYITVDDQCRTSVPGIWAMGDVNGRGAFTHTSYNDYEIVAANLFDNDPRKIGDRIPAYGLFIDPPLGRVGMTEAEVRKKGIKALSGRLEMTSIGRARERGETKGFMRVIADAETRRILGAAILGIGGDEVVHTFLELMASGAPYTAMSRAVHIHPTVAEYLPVVLGNMEPLT
jgi:pyruvate/2-oxoglutarate dehydrogenase complex dihydrolipoamide dehydrogenase (E3) component